MNFKKTTSFRGSGEMHVKYEVDDFLEEENGHFAKRPRTLSSFQDSTNFDQSGVWNNEFPVPPSQYNPLDEPSPLGLRLRKSPSLLDLIQMKLSQTNDSAIVAPAAPAPTQNHNSGGKEDAKITTVVGTTNKLKASNFPASILRIGRWEFFSRHEGDLVAKCYFSKHKLVWEVLQYGLKRKIEIQWSHIMAFRANCPDDGPGTLTVVLSRQPLFFSETNPQPRKHTLWQACADFTDGQASQYREHFLQCPSGSLSKHYEKMIQSDMRLNLLSQQPGIVFKSPYFENTYEANIPGLSECSTTSGSTTSATSSMSDHLTLPRSRNCVSKGAPSPTSVMDTCSTEGNKNSVVCDSQSSMSGEHMNSKSGELLQMPGLRPSMSVSDLVNHIGDHITEQITSRNMPSQKALECQSMLESISQMLLSDTPYTADSDEKSLMKRVNSLCSLLQDPATSNLQTQVGEVHVEGLSNANQGGTSHFIDVTHWENNSHANSTTEQNFNNILAPPLPRTDSMGDLLLQLPRIASLPRFLFDVVEDDDRRK